MNRLRKPTVALIGAGRVGSAIAVLLSRRGYRILGVADVRKRKADLLAAKVGASLSTRSAARVSGLAELVFITTPDSAVELVCRRIAEAGKVRPGTVVIHTSGVLDSDALAAARDCGALALSLHPIQTFADPESAIKNLPGSFFGVEGDPGALAWGRRIAKDLGGKPILVAREHKALYHAAACVSSNYLVTLLEFTLCLLAEAGIPRALALQAILPLVLTTVSNVQKVGIPRALTGPIERGDVGTIERQLRALQASLPEWLDVYESLGRHTVEIAERKRSIPPEVARKLRDML